MGGETSLAGITSCASRNRQSLQDWFRVAPVTPGIHLRWLPGARVEFPYRERTMGVARDRGIRFDGRCDVSVPWQISRYRERTMGVVLEVTGTV